MSWHELLGPMHRLPQPAALDVWFASLRSHGEESSFRLAVLGGRLAATPGLAFLAGYQAALRQLWPAAPEGLGAMCATENRALRPADMQTRVDGLSLTGRKDFVIAGSAASWLLVPARDEAPGERPRLSLCVVNSGERGVIVEAGPLLPLLQDIPHGRLRLEQAACRRLVGDGWDDYVKPFRTLEDVHVLAALASWLYGIGLDCGWPQQLQLRLLGLLAGAAEVSRLPPTEPATHLLLASLNLQLATLSDEVDEALAVGPQAVAAALAARPRRAATCARGSGQASGSGCCSLRTDARPKSGVIISWRQRGNSLWRREPIQACRMARFGIYRFRDARDGAHPALTRTRISMHSSCIATTARHAAHLGCVLS